MSTPFGQRIRRPRRAAGGASVPGNDPCASRMSPPTAAGGRTHTRHHDQDNEYPPPHRLRRRRCRRPRPHGVRLEPGERVDALSNPPSTKPTIVLVHGAWADGSSFAPEIAALQLAGYPVLVAPPNPLRGVENDTTALVNFLHQKTSGPVVLVAHSYGGVVITGAGLTDPT